METLEFGEPPSVNTFVIEEVLRVHVKDEFWKEGEIQPSGLKTIGRMG